MPSDGEDLTPSARGRKRTALLLLPLAVSWVAFALGTAMAPVLLERSPILLLLLAPLPRHLVLVATLLDPAPYYALGLVRLFVVDPFMYRLGTIHGEAAAYAIGKKLRVSERVVRALVTLAEDAGPIALFVSPDPFMSLLVGATGMRLGPFLAVNLAGTVAMLVLARKLGARFAEPIALARQFIGEHWVAALVLSLCFVGVGVVRHLLRKREPDGKAP